MGHGALATAVRWGAELQGPASDVADVEIRVIHVDTNNAGSAPLGVRRSDTRLELEEELAAALESAGATTSVRLTQELLQDSSPAEEILRYTRANRVDLLVMGTRGDHPLVKALLGSVSAAVARSVEVPLLLVPPPVWKQNHRAAAGEDGRPEWAFTAAD